MNAPWPLWPPVARRMHPSDVTEFARRGWHCETRGCRGPAVIVTERTYTHRGHARRSEHFACEAHGAAFAARYHTEIEPPVEREARRLTGPEIAEFAADGAHCDAPGCPNQATCIFLEHYELRGGRDVLERLACDRHVARFTEQLHVEPGDVPASSTATSPPEIPEPPPVTDSRSAAGDLPHLP